MFRIKRTLQQRPDSQQLELPAPQREPHVERQMTPRCGRPMDSQQAPGHPPLSVKRAPSWPTALRIEQLLEHR